MMNLMVNNISITALIVLRENGTIIAVENCCHEV